jgi:NADH-quinone oxidoreductase subunit E
MRIERILQEKVQIEQNSKALEIIDSETTPDCLFTLKSVAYLGCCSLAPFIIIDKDVYNKQDGNATVRISLKIKI